LKSESPKSQTIRRPLLFFIARLAVVVALASFVVIPQGSASALAFVVAIVVVVTLDLTQELSS
jgi:hypothetical protein